MKISVCIPVYNESGRIKACADTLDAYMKEHFADYEIIFSNDGSTDSSAEEIASVCSGNIRSVGYSVNRGKGYAVRTAFLAAAGDIMLFTDCDLAYGTDVIDAMYRMFEGDPGIDIVIGSRAIAEDGYEGYTPIRRLASKTYIRVLSLIGGFSLSDSQCGFKGFRGGIGKRIFSACEVERWAFDFEALMIASKMHAKIAEMPVKVINHGESKVRVFRDSLKMLCDLVKIRRRVSKLDFESKQ